MAEYEPWHPYTPPFCKPEECDHQGGLSFKDARCSQCCSCNECSDTRADSLVEEKANG